MNINSNLELHLSAYTPFTAEGKRYLSALEYVCDVLECHKEDLNAFVSKSISNHYLRKIQEALRVAYDTLFLTYAELRDSLVVNKYFYEHIPSSDVFLQGDRGKLQETNTIGNVLNALRAKYISTKVYSEEFQASTLLTNFLLLHKVRDGVTATDQALLRFMESKIVQKNIPMDEAYRYSKANKVIAHTVIPEFDIYNHFLSKKAAYRTYVYLRNETTLTEEEVFTHFYEELYQKWAFKGFHEILMKTYAPHLPYQFLPTEKQMPFLSLEEIKAWYTEETMFLAKPPHTCTFDEGKVTLPFTNLKLPYPITIDGYTYSSVYAYVEAQLHPNEPLLSVLEKAVKYKCVRNTFLNQLALLYKAPSMTYEDDDFSPEVNALICKSYLCVQSFVQQKEQPSSLLYTTPKVLSLFSSFLEEMKRRFVNTRLDVQTYLDLFHNIQVPNTPVNVTFYAPITIDVCSESILTEYCIRIFNTEILTFFDDDDILRDLEVEALFDSYIDRSILPNLEERLEVKYKMHSKEVIESGLDEPSLFSEYFKSKCVIS